MEVGFNQSEVTVTEGNSTVVLCAEITAGTLERDITVYLETDSPDTLPGNGESVNCEQKPSIHTVQALLFSDNFA